MNAAAPQEAGGAAAFPWDEAMTLGLGRLGLHPAAFWAMSPREFARAIAPLLPAHGGAPRRADLDALMTRFPDP